MKFQYLILLIIFHCILPFIAHASTVPSPSDVLSWANDVAKFHTGLREKLDDIDDSYEIVFIPGILGSELTIGKYVYGKDRIEAKELLFNPKQHVEPKILNTFQSGSGLVFKKIDIYGSGLDSLKSAYHGKAAKEFAYDWRADIRISADKFNEYAKQTLKNKNVVIIAHSMGGLVAWQWKNTYRKIDRPFKLIALVLIGSPLQGSCEPASMLVKGYSAPEGSSAFEKWATHWVFDRAYPAIFTFPSVFQLLPKFDEDSPCIKMNLPNDTKIPQNHHLVDTWIGRPDGSYRLGNTDNSSRQKFFEKVGLNEETYYNLVREAINVGSRFRSSFDLNQGDDQVYYLYSDKENMKQLYHIVPKNGWLYIDEEVGVIKGDGRVGYESAINKDYSNPVYGSTWLLHEEHGKLLSDPDFPKFISRDIAQLIKHSKMMKILAYAIQDSNLKREIENRGWRTLDVSSLSKSLTSDPEFVLARQSIAMYNASQIPDNKLPSFMRLINYARSMPTNLELPSEEIESHVASLLDSAVVLAPESVDYQVLEQLGMIRYKQKQYVDATSAFNESIQKLNSRYPKSLYGLTFYNKKIELYKALGKTYEALGAKDLEANVRNEIAVTTAEAKYSVDGGSKRGLSVGTIAAGPTLIGILIVIVAILLLL